MDEHLETSRYAIKTLEKALRIYTPSLNEKALADFLADRCDDLGFRDIHQDEVGNIIATKGSGEPKIMLCGHMDVCLLYTSPSPRDRSVSRMPSSA